MLTLVGLGLSDEKDLTLRGIEEAKAADKVYIELYTGVWKGSLENLQKILGKEIFQLQRSDLEENSQKILDEAREKNIVILVQGDPLVATTHSSLLLEAKKQKISTKVVHNSSIISAIGETGLHIYKFGATVTIPFPEKTGGKLSESVYRTIEENKKRGLHTLCLLDVAKEGNGCMKIAEASKFLMEMEEKFGGNVTSAGEKVVVLSDVGSNSKIVYLEIGKIGKIDDFGNDAAILIMPGKLHFTEKEFLEEIKG